MVRDFLGLGCPRSPTSKIVAKEHGQQVSFELRWKAASIDAM